MAAAGAYWAFFGPIISVLVALRVAAITANRSEATAESLTAPEAGSSSAAASSIKNATIAASVGLICGGLSYFVYQAMQPPPTVGEDWGVLSAVVYGACGALLGLFTFGILHVTFLSGIPVERTNALMVLAWVATLVVVSLLFTNSPVDFFASPAAAVLAAVGIRYFRRPTLKTTLD
jgi:hypothetical protein